MKELITSVNTASRILHIGWFGYCDATNVTDETTIATSMCPCYKGLSCDKILFERLSFFAGYKKAIGDKLRQGVKLWYL